MDKVIIRDERACREAKKFSVGVKNLAESYRKAAKIEMPIDVKQFEHTLSLLDEGSQAIDAAIAVWEGEHPPQ